MVGGHRGHLGLGEQTLEVHEPGLGEEVPDLLRRVIEGEGAVEREVERARAEMAEAREDARATDDPLAQEVLGLELALRDIRRFDRLFRLVLTDGDRVPELRATITAALAPPSELLTWEDDPTTVLSIAALAGHHFASLLQGRPFQGVSQDEFIA